MLISLVRFINVLSHLLSSILPLSALYNYMIEVSEAWSQVSPNGLGTYSPLSSMVSARRGSNTRPFQPEEMNLRKSLWK